MVAEILQRRLRQGVDGVGADQLLYVENVAVGRVLGAGAGPQESLRSGPTGGEALPAVLGSELAVVGVGQLGVGDGHLAKEASQGHPIAGATALGEARLNPVFHHGVDATHEKTGNTGYARQLSAPSGQSFQSGHVSGSHLDIVFSREQKSDVDVEPLGDELLYSGNAGCRTRHLDHQIPSPHLAGQAQGFLHCSRGVVSQPGGDFQRYEPVAALGLLVHGQQHIGRPLYVLDGDGLIDLQRRSPGGDELAQGSGVFAGTGYGLFEDGGIGGHAPNSVLGNQALHLARHDHAASYVIVPHALALLPQFQERVGHGHAPRSRTPRLEDDDDVGGRRAASKAAGREIGGEHDSSRLATLGARGRYRRGADRWTRHRSA